MSVGYEGASIEEFIEDLRTMGVKALADVRLAARSRKKGFAKTRLTAMLAEAGIEYHHFPALGNPKDNREPFWTGRGLEAALDRCRETVRTESGFAALEQIKDLSARGGVAVFCFEADESRCHRQVILEALQPGRTSVE